jgi:hypothetical protein
MSGIGESFDRWRHLSRALIVGVAVIAAGAVAIGQGTREVFSTTAMSTGGPQTSPVASRLTFTINRWTTSDQAQKLADILKKGGPKAMLAQLVDFKEVGLISSPGTIGYPLQYAAQEMLPDGSRHIVLMTDRPISFAEAWAQSNTVDYPITYIELKVDRDGKGSGKMIVAAKLISAGKLIVAEDWGVAPIQLNDVRKQN